MNILGLADGPDAGAALLVNNRVVAAVEQERLDRRPHSRAFPWDAAEACLEVAGLAPGDIDMVAVAGRFSPPFFLRRHPSLRGLARDAFSPLLDIEVFYQAMLRQSGFGALEADRAADWLHGRLRERGYGMRRTHLVDLHRCLAEAAHRCQASDPVLVVTAHPNGDGSGLAAYRGAAGQLDRIWAQKGFASLHVHLRRCIAAMGAPTDDVSAIWAVAIGADPDPDLVGHLDELLHAEGRRLSRKRYPFPERRSDYEPIARVPLAVAAASLQENLARAITAVVRAHARDTGLRHVALGGGVFEDPRLVSRVAALAEVEVVSAPPLRGWSSLALGAAASVGGLAPAPLRGPGLGTLISEAQGASSLGGRRAEAASTEAVAGLLLRGVGVARATGRGGFGRHGGGTRSVLCTLEGLPGAALALGRDVREAVWLSLGDEAAALAGVRWGESPVGPGPVQAILADDDPTLASVLRHLEARGHAILAALPLGIAREPSAERARDALDVFTRSSLEALWLGPHLIRR